jgi:energy-coupling factor transporter ATP-binding protein EcfA2
MAAEQPEGIVIEERPWEEMWEDGTIEWEPGQHWTVVGPTGIGKTTVLVDLCERSPHHAVLVITKNKDSLVTRLPKERGWVLVDNLADFKKQFKRSWGDRWEKRERPAQRIVYHPKLEQISLRNRADVLGDRVEELLTYVYYEGSAHGGVSIAIDEATGASQQLGLQKPLTLMWDESRSNNVEVLAGLQRPAYVPKASENAATYLVIFGGMTNDDDLLALSKMAGYTDRKQIREALEALPEHHHLLVKTRKGKFLVESRVVIRKRNAA